MYNSILRNCMFHFKMFATNFYAEFSKFPCCPAFKSVPLRYNYFVTRYITVIYCHILVYLELRRIIWLFSMYNSSLRNQACSCIFLIFLPPSLDNFAFRLYVVFFQISCCSALKSELLRYIHLLIRFITAIYFHMLC